MKPRCSERPFSCEKRASWKKKQQHNNNNNKKHSKRESKRMASHAWGSAARKPETLETESLDSRGLLSATQTKTNQQEDKLARIGESVKRTKEVAIAIGGELNDQNKLLDKVDSHVSKVDGRLKGETKRVRILTEKAPQNGMMGIIAILFIIIIVLIFLVIFLH